MTPAEKILAGTRVERIVSERPESADSDAPAWLDDGASPEESAGSVPETPEWTAPNVTSYGADFDPAKIPLRRWLLGNRRSVGEVTIDAVPPGTNKSTLMLTDAVSIVSGRKILADDVHETSGVLYLAGEDARRDVEARLAGI